MENNAGQKARVCSNCRATCARRSAPNANSKMQSMKAFDESADVSDFSNIGFASLSDS